MSSCVPAQAIVTALSTTRKAVSGGGSGNRVCKGFRAHNDGAGTLVFIFEVKHGANWETFIRLTVGANNVGMSTVVVSLTGSETINVSTASAPAGSASATFEYVTHEV